MLVQNTEGTLRLGDPNCDLPSEPDLLCFSPKVLKTGFVENKLVLVGVLNAFLGGFRMRQTNLT